MPPKTNQPSFPKKPIAGKFPVKNSKVPPTKPPVVDLKDSMARRLAK